MTQELSEGKISSRISAAPATRSNASKPKLGSPNSISPGSRGGPKAISPESNNNQRLKRSVFGTKPSFDGDPIQEKREREVEDSKYSKTRTQHGVRAAEQYARVQRGSDPNCRRAEHDRETKTKELQKRLDESESLVKDLQLEVLSSKEEIDKLQGLNFELEAENKKLSDNLTAAESKIEALERHNQVVSASRERDTSELRSVEKLIGNKLHQFRGYQEVIDEENKSSQLQSLPLNAGAKSVKIELELASNGPLKSSKVSKAPPPPPPLPPRAGPARENTKQKATALVEFYHCLAKREGKRDVKSNGSCSNLSASSVHNSIVDELQNRSAHLLAIKADVETKAELINYLIERVQLAAYTNMEDVLTFVDWLDVELSKLADERAVLKHFNWPEKKADALREAAIEYRDVKQLLTEVSSFKDDASLACEAILRKTAVFLDKLERNVQRLIKLRGMAVITFRQFKIPTDWMLDSGMISMIKLASIKLAKFHIKRVLTELDCTRQLERGSVQEALLFEGVRFAYRVYQFAGGLDSETMRAFEELRNRVQWRESRELLQGLSLP
ncbi:Protein CHUP1, chloroplastic [Apostasia shenzhenica]|uniref:Protein CHUP1, chloroplastic n=1 Tax=Apostasia shenzhenica TaxID=1088818 RepID=A0A2I0AAZ5_9ASPA|nr:Protein CHUP1, chloroplastic [Apostasia shenzhenica]